MHNNEFAHRDLKPQVLSPPSLLRFISNYPKNIFVLSTGPEWWVKIVDFGISKRVMEGLAGVQTFNGAPAFTAPEVYTRMWEPVADRHTTSSDLNPDANVWSLGLINYYLLTGKLPFTGQRELLSYYTLLPYTRRRSDAAPIPLADLKYTTPRVQSPVESRGSTISSAWDSIDRHSSDRRLSERIRHVSGSMLPKRHQRSQDHVKKIGVLISQT